MFFAGLRFINISTTSEGFVVLSTIKLKTLWVPAFTSELLVCQVVFCKWEVELDVNWAVGFDVNRKFELDAK